MKAMQLTAAMLDLPITDISHVLNEINLQRKVMDDIKNTRYRSKMWRINRKK